MGCRLNLVYKPLAFFRSSHKETYEAPRQGVLARGSSGWFELEKAYGPETLEDLIGFDRIWIIYDFHKNSDWKPKVRPPRFSEKKRSVFSTRSPYRPNSIGMSCVKLDRIEGRRVFVSDHDLLDGTPVLDIKPYIPYADSFPKAKTGWLKSDKGFEVKISEVVLKAIQWLEEKTHLDLRQILVNQLAYEPTNSKAKRVKKVDSGYVFAVRTWRFDFTLVGEAVEVRRVFSGYSEAELQSSEDLYGDKSLHREFLNLFS